MKTFFVHESEKIYIRSFSVAPSGAFADWGCHEESLRKAVATDESAGLLLVGCYHKGVVGFSKARYFTHSQIFIILLMPKTGSVLNCISVSVLWKSVVILITCCQV